MAVVDGAGSFVTSEEASGLSSVGRSKINVVFKKSMFLVAVVSIVFSNINVFMFLLNALLGGGGVNFAVMSMFFWI